MNGVLTMIQAATGRCGLGSRLGIRKYFRGLVGADVPAARPEVGPYLANVFMQKEVRLSRFQSGSYTGGHSC